MPTHIRRIFYLALLLVFPTGVYAQVKADFSASPTSECGPITIFFQDKSTGSPTLLEWDFGDGSGKGYGSAPSHLYPINNTSIPKTYTITLKASKPGSSDTKIKTAYITIHETPQVDFTVTPQSGCAPLNVTFTDRSVAGGSGVNNSYSWLFGNVGTSTAQNPTFTFLNSGGYNISLYVTNSWKCTGSKTKNGYINVVPKPVVNFGVDKSVFCGSQALVNFTNSSTGAGSLSYKWDFDDATAPDFTTTPSHTYTGNPMCWSPKLVVTDGNGCQDSLTIPNLVCSYTVNVTSVMPVGVCIGISGSFSATGSPSTPAPGTYTWDWGDGSPNSTGATASHTFNSAGIKTVVVTYSYKGCTATSTKLVTVYPQPVGSFTISPDTLCPAPVTTQFIPSGTFQSYFWDFGDGSNTSSQVSPTHTYTTNGYFSPTFIFKSSDGCYDTVTRQDYVKIFDLNVNAYAPDTEGCKPLSVDFKNKVYTNIPLVGAPHVYPYPIATYYWDFGDGQTSTDAQPTHVYTVSGTYKAVLTVTTTKGCVTTDTVTVRVGTKPLANFDASPLHICTGQTVCFTDLSTDTVNHWHWWFGPPKQESTQQNPCYKYTMPGIWTVKLLVDYNTCEDDTIMTFLIQADSPGVGYQAVYSCDTPKKINFVNTTIGATSYQWFFGDGQTDTAQSPSHIYANYTSYTTMLIATNSRSHCSDTMQVPVQFVQGTKDMTANDTAICTGDRVTFNVIKTGLPAYATVWYIDNIFITDSFMRTTEPFYIKGFHKVKVVIQDSHGCVDSVVKDPFIFVSRPVAADTVSSVAGCAPITVTFTDKSTVPVGATIASRFWNFGNGTANATGPTITRTYARGGYDVKLIVTDNVGCVDSVLKTGYVNSYKPTVDFKVKDTSCIGEFLAFTNNSSVQVNPGHAFWDFGDGGTSTDYSPSHPFNTLGSFAVKLVITDDYGCKDSVTKPAAVNTVKGYPSFTMSDSVAVCPPLLVKFTNTSTGTVAPYAWDMGDGNTSRSVNVNNVYTAPGLYTIMLISKNKFSCIDTAYGHVNILGYAGSFTYGPLDGCKPLTVTFNSTTTNVASMVWDFSDGVTTSSVGGSVTHTYDHAGSYIPKLLYADAKGCKALADGIDPIRVDAVEVDFLGDAPCQYSTVTLIDTSKSYFSSKIIWRWTFEDGTTSDKSRAKHYFGSPGTYPIKLYVENARGCKDSLTKDFVIHGLPTIVASADTLICLTDSAHLNATGGASYHWTVYNNSLSCIDCPDPYAYPKGDAGYIVTGTDEFNCKNTDTVLVKIKTKVTAIVGPDAEICNKQIVQLTVTGGKTYKWTPPDGLDDSRSSAPNASPNTTTKYMVVSYEGRCIPDTDMVKVTVYPLPTVKATGSATIVAGNSTVIQATGNLIDKFKWTPADDLSCADCPDPTASPLKTTDYKIEVFTDHGCVDSDKVRIEVLCDKSQLFIPNSFTPNGDGQNDIFYPRGTGLDNIKSFRIYNRWGEMVYEKTSITINDKSVGWDGTYNGNQLPPDVFVYMIEALCTDGKTVLFKGDITLIR